MRRINKYVILYHTWLYILKVFEQGPLIAEPLIGLFHLNTYCPSKINTEIGPMTILKKLSRTFETRLKENNKVIVNPSKVIIV